MARLFADENFPLPAVEALRRLGHNVLTIHEAGKAQQSTPDDIVLKWDRLVIGVRLIQQAAAVKIDRTDLAQCDEVTR